ncbi:MAG: hypothetical protein PHQ28_09030 [Mycobacterium sp.]|nr:hypothetical protein [Mycobacterium sp.]
MAAGFGRRGRLLRRVGIGRLGAVGSALVVAACSVPGAPETTPEVVLWSAGSALHQPVWSYRMHALVALTEDQRLAELTTDPTRSDAKTRLSAPLGAGRNLQISQKDPRVVFVPQPQRGEVAAVDLETLREPRGFHAGPAPAYLAQDAGLRVLLALSADGKSVTPVDQYGERALPTAAVAGAPASGLAGLNRGRDIGYHLYGGSGIRYYQGTSSPPAERGALDMDVAVWAGDGTAATRSYVAGPNDNVLRAVDSRRSGAGLEVLGSARLPSPIRALGTDDTRIYAATDNELVVLETDSFTGYRHGTIPVLRVIGYRSGLPGAAGKAPLSGMAIGPRRVYLTLDRTPYVVGVAKPHL